MKKAIIPILVILILAVWGGITYLYLKPAGSNSTAPSLPTLFAEYRAALVRKDINSLKLLMTQETYAKILPSVAQGKVNLPPNVTVKTATVNGTNAVLELASTVEGKAMSGKAHFVKVEKAWLLNMEDVWTVDTTAAATPAQPTTPVEPVTNTAPHVETPVTAEIPAEDIQPVPLDFYSPGVTPECHADIIAYASNDVTAVAFTPNGKYLVTASYGDFSVKVWNTETWTETASLKTENRVRSITMGQDGQTFWTADAYLNILQWQILNGGLTTPTLFLTNAGDYVTMSPDGTRMAATAFQTPIRLWELADQQLKDTPPAVLASKDHRIIQFFPDGTNFVTAGLGNTYSIWKLAGSKCTRVVHTIAQVDAITSEVMALALNADATLMVSGHNDSSIVIHDLATGTERFNYFIKDASTMALAISRDNNILVSANLQTLYLWDLISSEPELNRPTQLAMLTGHSTTIRSLAFSPDGSTLVSGDEAGHMRIWKPGPAPDSTPQSNTTEPDTSIPEDSTVPDETVSSASTPATEPDSSVEEAEDTSPDHNNMQVGVTVYKPKMKPKPKASGSISFRKRPNWVLNPSADSGLTNWIHHDAVGVALVTSTERDSNPFFGVRKTSSLYQDICLTGQQERVILVIARTYSERFNPQGDVTGYPQIHGDWINMDKSQGRLQGHMDAPSLTFRPKYANQWGVAMGVFEIPKKATHLRLHLQEATGLTHLTDSLAGFDDVSVYFFGSAEAARRQGENFSKAATAMPR